MTEQLAIRGYEKLPDVSDLVDDGRAAWLAGGPEARAHVAITAEFALRSAIDGNTGHLHTLPLVLSEAGRDAAPYLQGESDGVDLDERKFTLADVYTGMSIAIARNDTALRYSVPSMDFIDDCIAPIRSNSKFQGVRPSVRLVNRILTPAVGAAGAKRTNLLTGFLDSIILPDGFKHYGADKPWFSGVDAFLGGTVDAICVSIGRIRGEEVSFDAEERAKQLPEMIASKEEELRRKHKNLLPQDVTRMRRILGLYGVKSLV